MENYRSLLEISENDDDFVGEELNRSGAAANVLISSKERKRPGDHAANVPPGPTIRSSRRVTSGFMV